MRHSLDVFAVDGSAAVYLTHLQLKRNVPLEDVLLAAHACIIVSLQQGWGVGGGGGMSE